MHCSRLTTGDWQPRMCQDLMVLNEWYKDWGVVMWSVHNWKRCYLSTYYCLYHAVSLTCSKDTGGRVSSTCASNGAVQKEGTEMCAPFLCLDWSCTVWRPEAKSEHFMGRPHMGWVSAQALCHLPTIKASQVLSGRNLACCVCINKCNMQHNMQYINTFM